MHRYMYIYNHVLYSGRIIFTNLFAFHGSDALSPAGCHPPPADRQPSAATGQQPTAIGRPSAGRSPAARQPPLPGVQGEH